MKEKFLSFIGSKKALYLAIALFSVGVILSVSLIIFNCLNNASAKKNYEEMSDNYTEKTDALQQMEDDTPELTEEEKLRLLLEEDPDYLYKTMPFPYTVDYERIAEKYPDIIGWIYCDNDVIDYPIVYDFTDKDFGTYYLKHDPSGNYNTNGSIFLQRGCNADFTSTNTILHGHNMYTGAMFACLHNFKDQAYYEEHPYMYISTPQGNYVFVIFSGYDAEPDGDVYNTEFYSEDEFSKWIANQMENSLIETGVEVRYGDKVMTLSTCSSAFPYAKYVLLGKLVEVSCVDNAAEAKEAQTTS